MIKVKSAEEIELIRRACGVVSEVIKQLKVYVRTGISTKQLDELAKKLLRELGATSAFKGYRGYPANICTSVNEQVVHGIPGSRRLKEGDIISIDVGAKLKGYFGDAACTWPVGRISQKADKLLSVGRGALAAGIAQACEGNHLLDISSHIQSYVESSGCSVVRKFVGHGIGSQMHEEPEIPNFGKAGLGPLLKAGMVLAIEPMVNEGTFEVEILKDKWTAVTKDRKLSAHFEHTVCVTKDKPEVLTAWE
ncbi:MAG: type I methionyl aminopeptidase [Candidatus Omnitrophota bacterium]|nr:MAG: type I methionyl aminopeptidase [Candidatus Omnitrophota bacterium]